jgi:hypothetical protein
VDGIALLQQAHAAGLCVRVEGALLKIRGPRHAEPVAQKLIAHKAAVMAALSGQRASLTHTCGNPGNRGNPPDTRLGNPVTTVTGVTGSCLAGWNGEDAALIGWFLGASDRLPTQPYRLVPWRLVSDPAKWYLALSRDIAAGPRSCRARFGALQEDLRLLRAFAEQLC